MEKLIFDNADKGYPGSFRLFESVNSKNITNGFEAVIRSLIGDAVSADDIFILTGCTIAVDGQDFTLSAGLVYYQDEIFEVDAIVFTAAGGETAVWATDFTIIDLKFSDGQTYNARESRKLTLISGPAGSGIADYNETDGIFEKVKRNIVGPGTGREIIDVELADKSWDMNTTALVSVAHGLDKFKIKDVKVSIRSSPPNNDQYDLGANGDGYWQVDGDLIKLRRADGGIFHNIDFQSAKAIITVEYKE